MNLRPIALAGILGFGVGEAVDMVHERERRESDQQLVQLVSSLEEKTQVCRARVEEVLELAENIGDLKDKQLRQCQKIAAINTAVSQQIQDQAIIARKTQQLIALKDELIRLREKQMRDKRALTIPCDLHETLEVNEIRDWITAHAADMQQKTAAACENRSDCKNSFSFWENFKTTVQQAHVFCPKKRPDGQGNLAGRVIEDHSEDFPGSMAIFRMRIRSTCSNIGTMAHEAAHLATGENHADAGIVDDWFYMIGNAAEDICRESLD